jgi:hypothetical protein
MDSEPTHGVSMKVGDIVMYMGHTGIILERALTNESFTQHWYVWFFDSRSYVLVYEPLMKKVKKIT